MLAEWLIITHREPKARWESSRRYNGIIRDSSVKEMPFTRSSWNTGNIQQGKISDLRNKYMWGFIEGLECMDIQYVLKRHSCTWKEETAYFEFNVRKFSFLIIKWVPGEVVAAVKWEQAIIIVSTCKKIWVRFPPSPQSEHSVCSSFRTLMFVSTSDGYLINSWVHSDDVSLEISDSPGFSHVFYSVFTLQHGFRCWTSIWSKYFEL